MNNKKYTLLFLFLFATWILVFDSCKTQEYTPADYPGEQIVFGNGGGFTGRVSTYYLLSNGQLFKKGPKDSNISESQKLDKKLVDQFFDSYDYFNMDDIVINDPGNMYYFLKMKRNNSEHAMTWGGTNEKVDPTVKQMYTNLMRIISSQKK